MVFLPRSYRCWQDMIDLDSNPIGWGYDRLVHSVCSAKMGIDDSVGTAHHMGTSSSYNRSIAQVEEAAIIEKYDRLGYASVPADRDPCLGKWSFEQIINVGQPLCGWLDYPQLGRQL